MTDPLLELPTRLLLEKFGSGRHAPGSGSAAALMGLLSARLIMTVGTLTLRKPDYRQSHADLESIATTISNTIEPRLRDLFQRDAKVFDEVIKLRIARDQARDDHEKRHLGDQALQRLEEATDIPIEIAQLCLKLIDHGTSVFDLGFKGARGDSGAAISAAVAGAMSGIFVTNLNLRSFRTGEWAAERRRACDELHRTLTEKQLAAFGRVVELKDAPIAALAQPFDAPTG